MQIMITNDNVKIKQEFLTEIVKRLIFDIPKIELCQILDISRPTLDRRLKFHDWTYAEYLSIEHLRKTNKICLVG